MKRKLCVAAVLAAMSLLGACGGGGSEGGTMASTSVGSSSASASAAPGAAPTSAAPASATASAASGSASASAGSVAPASPVARVEPGIVASDTPIDDYTRLADAAETKRKEVEDQAVNGPCQSDNQCALLSFNEYAGPCAFPTSVPYLLGSATAEAVVRGTEEFNVLSSQAAAARPSYGMVMCAMMVRLVAPRCDTQEKKCVVGDGLVFAPEPVVLPAATPVN